MLIVIVDVIDQNRALIGTLETVRSQMNFKRLSSISRLKLAVPSLEIDLWLGPVGQLKAETIVILDLNRLFSLVPLPPSDDILIIL